MASISRILKSNVFVIFFLIVFLLSGCFKNPMKCPADYPGSVWKCDSPFIILYVTGGGATNNHRAFPNFLAYMEVNEEIKEIYFCIDSIRYNAPIYDYEICESKGFMSPDALLLDTECHYYEDKIVMKILADNVYGGEYKEVILERIK